MRLANSSSLVFVLKSLFCLRFSQLVARRVALVVAFAFLLQIVGRWQGSMNDILSLYSDLNSCNLKLYFLHSEVVVMLQHCSLTLLLLCPCPNEPPGEIFTA